MDQTIMNQTVSQESVLEPALWNIFYYEVLNCKMMGDDVILVSAAPGIKSLKSKVPPP